MLNINLNNLNKRQLENRLETVINKAHKSRCNSCPYCTQNDPGFVKNYGHAKIASPAFFSGGQWYHLNLKNQDKKYKGGFNWFDCRGGWGNGMLVAAGFHRPSLSDAVNEAGKILSLPDGKMSFQNYKLSSIFMGGDMLIKGSNPVYETA